MKKIKFYIPKKLVLKEVSRIPLLFPFWGIPEMENIPYNKKLFNKYNYDRKYYELTENINEANFVLIPHNYGRLKNKYPEIIQKYINFADRYKKPLLIDAVSDINYKINIKNVYILKIGQYRFEKRKRKNEIVLPPYADDLLEEFFDGEVGFREKTEIPVIGFVGWVSVSLKQRIRSLLRGFPNFFLGLFCKKYGAKKKGVFFRKECLSRLENSDLTKTNFIKRGAYSGHLKTVEKNPIEARKEFVDNMFNSDYGLSVRGDANESVRFYENLSMGRVPLILDTEVVLPFEDEIDYKKFCVFVNFRDIKNIDKILRNFHDNITTEQFKEMQRKAREVYVDYLRIDNLTKHLMKRLKNIKYEE